ncbi:glutathione peroxidase [Conexibacter sp. W3-3-2]|uniref:glutathione peroxidase n=1 Tax=Conexibacter sp. W3-3-2 TaxID=2675227 RepID=UPI0012B8C48F|nr:glutathione peroxidase [Conexibacter sp. W3-3-2]MTD46490.1 glutathione peroxidase [Conexibacter sp. W3-3-2]
MRSRLCAGAVVLLGLAGCGSSEDTTTERSSSPTVVATPAAGTAPERSAPAAKGSSVLTGTAERLTGGRDDLADYRGDVVLVVNTASQCGFTGQFADLQELYAARKDRGFTILGFPSDSFDQELDDAQAIREVCEKNFGVEFPMFAKTAVTGDDAAPLFKRLAAATGEQPSWNFNKYLLDREGRVVGKFDSGDIPTDQIDELLAAT